MYTAYVLLIYGYHIQPDCNLITNFRENMYLHWRMSSSGMWGCVDLVWTDVSEERMASIFMVEKSESEEPAWVTCSQFLLHIFLLSPSELAWSQVIK
jgi:hypothetical protein